MLAVVTSDSFTFNLPTPKAVAFRATAFSFAKSTVTKPVATILDSFTFNSTAVGSITSVVAFVTAFATLVAGHLLSLLANLDYLTSSEN